MEDFEKYFRHFQVFHKMFRIRSFRKLFCKISENFQKYFWKCQDILPKFWGLFWNFSKKFQKISIIIAENCENYFVTFWEIIRKILRIIAENFDNHFKIFKKISEISWNTSHIFEKYFEKFRRIISRNKSEIFEKYFGKFWELYREFSTIISKKLDINFGRFRKILWTFSSISKNV